MLAGCSIASTTRRKLVSLLYCWTSYIYSKECAGSCKHSVCLMLQLIVWNWRNCTKIYFFAGCVCDVQIECDWFNGIQWFLAPPLGTDIDNPKSLGLNAWTIPQIRPWPLPSTPFLYLWFTSHPATQHCVLGATHIGDTEAANKSCWEDNDV